MSEGTSRTWAFTTCGQVVSQNSNMAVHMRTNTGDRSFICITCGIAFSRTDSLARHREKMHALDQE